MVGLCPSPPFVHSKLCSFAYEALWNVTMTMIPYNIYWNIFALFIVISKSGHVCLFCSFGRCYPVKCTSAELCPSDNGYCILVLSSIYMIDLSRKSHTTSKQISFIIYWYRQRKTDTHILPSVWMIAESELIYVWLGIAFDFILL